MNKLVFLKGADPNKDLIWSATKLYGINSLPLLCL